MMGMRILALSAVGIFAVDQATKGAVLYGLDLLSVGRIDIAPPFLTFIMAWNEGINFGVLASGSDVMRWSLVAVSVAISIGLAIWALRRDQGRWFNFGAGMVIGGALGNVVDRVRFGAVADFLNMSCCGFTNPYVFNVADIAIFAGAGLLILTTRDAEKKSG